MMLDNNDNSLSFEEADSDGFNICEIADGKKCGIVYVYYSEIDNVIDMLREIKKKYVE